MLLMTRARNLPGMKWGRRERNVAGRRHGRVRPGITGSLARESWAPVCFVIDLISTSKHFKYASAAATRHSYVSD
jgi:hypothetical protein